MATEIIVPELGESVVEATVGEWRKKPGEPVAVGEVIVELETDKVDIEVGATAAGVLGQILVPQGADVRIGDVLGILDETATPVPPANTGTAGGTPASSSPDPTAAPEARSATPVARRVAEAEGVDISLIQGTGPGGRVTKQDVVSRAVPQPSPAPLAAPAPEPAPKPVAAAAPAKAPAASPSAGRPEERIRLSRRRRTIAQRLVEAQHTAAMLTTFNEIDMTAVNELRQRRQEAFVARHGIKLGYMSFFVKACIGALRAFPAVNAELDGDDLILKHYYDIGIAVGAEEGLVVPVVRDADRKSFADIEREIKDLGARANEGALTLEELRGGTFTITNGGIFGSMMSTPILNPPQVGILGMHAILQRPVARNGEVVIRPMMYVALSYDHRVVDGREAVQFLVRVKQLLEDPEALLLEG